MAQRFIFKSYHYIKYVTFMQASKLVIPFVLVNFKTYLESTGENALMLGRVVEEVSKKSGVSMGIAVQAVDVRLCASELSIPVFAQHVDAVGTGSNTGAVLAEALVQAGAVGTLINHSEKRVGDVGACVQVAKRAGLMVMICAEDDVEAESFLNFSPDFIAVEPPELIGGDVSVSNAKPELISAAVEKLGSEKTVVGAGVKNGEDIKKARELGASGFLVASGVCKAEDPKQVLFDLVESL